MELQIWFMRGGRPPFIFYGYQSCAAHIQKRVGISLLIMVCPFVNLKAHMLIKASGLGILLIYGQSLNAIIFYAMQEQAFAQPFPSFLRSDKQHLQRAVLDPHESRRMSRIVLRDQQMGDSLQRLGNVFFDAVDLTVPTERDA